MTKGTSNDVQKHSLNFQLYGTNVLGITVGMDKIVRMKLLKMGFRQISMQEKIYDFYFFYTAIIYGLISGQTYGLCCMNKIP